MALDFGALQAEFFARGFSYLSDGGAGVTRAKRWLNDATHEIDGLYEWPYLLNEAAGSAPLSIPLLRRVLAVTTNAGVTLYERGLGDVANYLSAVPLGLPYYFLSGPTTVDQTYVPGGLMNVSFYQFAPDLVVNSDTPLMPDRYRMAIVDYACASALMDDDNAEEAQAVRQQGDTLVTRMRNALLGATVTDQQEDVAGPRGVREAQRERAA